jgi:hypothetical protein
MANAGAGEDCSERSCIDGYHCDFSGASPACIVDEEEPPEEEYSAGDSCDTDGDRCGGWINSGLACVDDNDDGLGTCTQVQIAEPGEACAFTTSGEMTITCRNGSMGSYYCMVDITSGVFSGTCERRPGAGEPCVETFNFCDPVEAYCDYVSGNCIATIPIGGACDPSDRSCAYGSTCDHEDLVCRDMMQFDVEETLVCG